MLNDVRTANDFMRRTLVTLRPEMNVIDGVTKLLKDNISGAPVADADGNYLGVFSEKCCMNALTDTVEIAHAAGMHIETAREFMTCDLVTLSANMDVFDAIDHILSKRISGAPVLGDQRKFEGIFSEKTAMQVLISAAYDQLPGTNVGAYMNTDRNRIIAEDASLLDVAHKFQETPYRRLPVLKGEALAGQISRRDVLRAEHRIANEVVTRARKERSDDRLRQANASADVASFMDEHAKTIHRGDDILNVAQIFLNSPYRRLPVVENNKLIGQVSRRDLLGAAADLLRRPTDRRQPATLYFSGVAEAMPPSI
tara:strand:+ start:64024 stop:64959 length:936 start_codon:yes stop_codon:yes gene_type:complete